MIGGTNSVAQSGSGAELVSLEICFSNCTVNYLNKYGEIDNAGCPCLISVSKFSIIYFSSTDYIYIDPAPASAVKSIHSISGTDGLKYTFCSVMADATLF